MRRNQHHLADALQHLIEAAESYATDSAAREAWHKEYGLQQAVERARRALARHLDVAGIERAPADILLDIRF